MHAHTASDIEPKELNERLQLRTLDVFDVRSPEEYLDEHITGAASNPVLAFDAESFPKDRPLAVYCGSSGRSGQAAEMLLAAGYGQVSVLKGGLAAWKQAGFATERSALGRAG